MWYCDFVLFPRTTLSQYHKKICAAFAFFKKKQYLCRVIQSTPWDYVFKGGQLQDIIKAPIALCFGLTESGKFYASKTLQHFDVLGICIFISVHAINRCVRSCTTYRRGLRCCLFGCKGNTRASLSGTATVQSRFFCRNKGSKMQYYES